MFLLQLQLYVLTIIRVTLRRIQKPLGESPYFVSLNIPFLVKGAKKVSFISFVASVPFWFLAGKYALENSSIVCRVLF